MYFCNSEIHIYFDIPFFKKALAPEKRPVLLSSSTHPGSGAFGGQFSEGYGYSFSEQKRALQTVINSGIAGIPFAGVPACGTIDDEGVT